MPPITTPPYFTVAELRAQDDDLADDTEFPDEQLEEIRIGVEEAIEDAAHVSFVPRESTESIYATAGHQLFLSRNRIRAITALSINGIDTLTTGCRPLGLRRIYRATAWAADSLVEITYEHGHDVPPYRIKQGALALAKNWLLNGPIDDRATQVPDESGGHINLATPGIQGSIFGLPELDAAVRFYGDPKPNPLGL